MGEYLPRILVAPEAAKTRGPAAAKLFERIGIDLYPWQRNALDVSLRRSCGKWAATRAGISVPRQSGKTMFLASRALAEVLLFADPVDKAAGKSPLVVWTAHLRSMVMESFNFMLSLIESNPDLDRLVKKINRRTAEEAIEFHSGARILFKARSKNALRGLSPSLILNDEAQDMGAEYYASASPSTRARNSPQVLNVGTPPHGDGSGGVPFTRVRVRSLDGAPRMCWLEWSAPEGSDVDDRDAWFIAMPTLGEQLSYENVEDDRASLSDEEFAAECMGMWDVASSGAVIDHHAWSALTAGYVDEAPARISLGIDVSPDRKLSTIVVVGERAGKIQLHIAKQAEGTDWLKPALLGMLEERRIDAVVVDRSSPAASLVLELKSEKVRRTKFFEANTGEVCKASALFYDYALNGHLAHNGNPLFADAAEAARKRPVGDAWAWGRKASASDITPVVAGTLALFGHLTTRRTKRDGAAPKIGYVKL